MASGDWMIGPYVVFEFDGFVTQLKLTKMTKTERPRWADRQTALGIVDVEFGIELTGRIFVPNLIHPVFDMMTQPRSSGWPYGYIEAPLRSGETFRLKTLMHDARTGPDTWTIRLMILPPIPYFDFVGEDYWELLAEDFKPSNTMSIVPKMHHRQSPYPESPRLLPEDQLYTQRIETEGGRHLWVRDLPLPTP